MHSEYQEKDQFLLSQLLLGKEDAFDFLFRKYYKILSIQAMRFVHDQDTAQSLVQDCFIHFCEKRRELNHIQDLYSYLSFMVRNRCLDHLREANRALKVQIANQTESSGFETEETIYANDLKFHLLQAMANLPERCRIAFEYSRIDGFTYSQIAIKMSISQKAVEALVSRALKLLRANLIDFLGILIFLITIWQI
jgi:RNA polymerase sigma-70 factor (ECF subfamily)